MARPMPRLEPVTRMVSDMGLTRCKGGEEGVAVGWAEDGQAGFGVDAFGVDAAGEHRHAIVVVKTAERLDGQFAARRKRVHIAAVVACAEQEAQAHRAVLLL